MCDVPSSVPSLLSGVLPLRCSLQVLSLHESLPTAINLFELLQFPALRRLKVERIDEFEIPKGILSSLDCSDTDNQLQVLELGSCIEPSALKAIHFSFSGSLKELICSVPVRNEWIDYMPSSWPSMLRTFSPERILSTLAPSADTLTRLGLRDGSQQWLGHDGSRLDLSSFIALKYLAATASCFVAPLSLIDSRNGQYSLLPRFLEKLHVSGMANFY
jgi:hypothetical protein